ncbi:NAD(P)/FAD-dependent oxidoreductase [Jiulongibacter sp. NS-SX5]|uniref:NAD(P)/FAD-dependent oxidoreductase n=1 Tax=Jiulongibacter sp. NS-SX5 TaxID=3463854 RepID=UPI0040597843
MIGGGAAGFFAAINCPAKSKVLILEKNRKPLQKVKVSGGGRCNVTHYCFEPELLVENYPRGKDFLLEPFQRFGPADTINWFENRGVKIKKESDGRMFPVTDDSQTIIDTFLAEARKKKVEVALSSKVHSFERSEDQWLVITEERKLICDKLLIASGGDKAIWEQLTGLGLNLVSPVPSLFTFHVPEKELHELSGISFPQMTVKTKGFKTSGPGLITHWGVSGPVVLKLSAFGARQFNDLDYQFDIQVDWLADVSIDHILTWLKKEQADNPKKKVRNTPLPGLTKRFWEFMCTKSLVGEFQNWSETGKKHFKRITDNLKKMPLKVTGKSTFKEEFVTAGGVDLSEIDSSTFELKRFPGLYLAGEVLDIDAVTGGFNFQAAWTGGWHVAQNLNE